MDLAEAQRIAVSFFAHRVEDGDRWEVRVPSDDEAAAAAGSENGRALVFEFRPPAGSEWQRSWPPLMVAVDPTTGHADILR